MDGSIEYSNDCGAYWFIDTNQDWVIRAGYTCTSFVRRHKKHTKCALLKSEQSKQSRLYCSYPHPDANVDSVLHSMKRGEWTDIKIVTGVCWTRENQEHVVNLFKWGDDVVNRLQKSRVKGSLLDKKEKMVSYLFETMLSLCLAPDKNISSNPSYESFNGRFKG